MSKAADADRDDEPTVVTKLLEELKEERQRTRTSLVEAAVRAVGIGRRLRRSDSQQAIQAYRFEPEPEPAE